MTGVEIAWSSDSPAVAAVDGDGLVTAVADGAATIAATAGELSASAAVTVETPPVATTLTVSPASARLEAPGQTVRLAAEVRDQNGAPMTGVEIAWSSDSPAVAAVDGDGLVTAVADGAATIAAAAGELSASAAVTVETPPVATTLTVSPASARLEAPGETVQLAAEVRDQNGDRMTGVEIVWSSDSPAVAAVDGDGLVTAVGDGAATVAATAGELSASAAVTVETPPDNAPDRAALVALYESTGGGNWVNSANWLSDRPLDEWHGVGLNRDGKVVSIGLTRNGLSGPVPPEIAQLAALRGLYLRGNNLSGSLPPELGGLMDLEALALSENSLSGPIPPELGSLANLQHLGLEFNRLSGPIPRELGALTRLTGLVLVRNELTGSIPPELGNLARLTELHLGSNELTGPIPPELGALMRLTGLYLFGNELTGPIPPELGSLANLQYLGLDGNRLSGPIPPELGSLANLQHLALDGNRLSGPIPPELGNLAMLEVLWVSFNNLSGTVPPELIGLPLRTFRWAGNPGLCVADTAAAAGFAEWAGMIGDHIGGSMCRSDRAALDALYGATGGSGWTNADGWPDGFPDTRHGIRADAVGRVLAIDLSANGLVGELPAALGDLDFLEELRLGGNPGLSGRLPYLLPRLEALSELRYAGTGLCVPTDDLLREWLAGVAVHEGTGEDCGSSPDREVLARLHETMGGSRWSETANWLTDAPLRDWHGVDADGQGRVTRLDLSYNGLVGPIPAEIHALEKLTELILYGADTQRAALPPELGELANLTTLGLEHINALGPIPPSLGKLARLKELNLFANGLSGPIPPELGDLAELTLLRLDYNRLAGPIPNRLGNATALEWIDLSNNELSGAIPTFLAGLERLRALDLSGNRLSDYLPAALGDFARLEYLNLSDNDLFGAIPAELGNLGSLTELLLFGNSLSGPVPPELGGLSNLRSLVLTGNAEMAGPLPEGLAGLRELSHLQAVGTKLCAPDDAALLAWLDGLLTRRVARCGVEPQPAYLTQAIQSRELPIALVAGEQALLRVFPTAARANAERMPAVRADFHLGGSLVHSVDIPSGPGPIPTELDEGSLDRSVNATIPAGVVQPGLEMAIEIDPGGTLDESLDVARRIPEAGRLAVEVRTMPRFDITFVPFVWETNPDMSVVELVDAMEADPGGHEMLRHVRTLLPVAEISVTAHAPVRTASNWVNELIVEAALIATMEGGGGHYMGLLAGEFEGSGGVAYIESRIAFSVTDAGVIAHEFGHNLSLEHAPCGGPAGVDPAYPHANASTGEWGYDFAEQRLVSPHEYFDLMAYCAPDWISDFSFDKALRYRLHGAGRLRPPETGAGGAPVPSLLVWGGVDAGSRPYLEPALVAEAPPAPPRAPGPWRIAGTTADGTALFGFSFAMPVAADGDGRSGFAFALPAQPGWAESLASITLSGPGGSVTLEPDAGPPVTVLRDGPAGQVTGIVREPAAADALRGATEPGLHSRGIPEPGAWSR